MAALAKAMISGWGASRVQVSCGTNKVATKNGWAGSSRIRASPALERFLKFLLP